MKRGSLTIGAPVLALASQAEAEAGTNNTKVMTPLRVAEAISALGGGAGPRPTLYVDSVNGYDRYDGRSEEAPVKTLAVAVSLAGDNEVIGLKRGSFWREALNLTALTAPTVVAYGSGAPPRITGMDHVPGAEWTHVGGGHPSVYTAEVPNGGGGRVRVFSLTPVPPPGDPTLEQLVGVADLATCETTPGSFVRTYGSTIYINPLDGLDPSSSSVQYQVTVRTNCILAQNDCSITGIETGEALSNNGSADLVARNNCAMRRTIGSNGIKHNLGIGDGVMEDCVAVGVDATTPEEPSNAAFVAFLENASGKTADFKRCGVIANGVGINNDYIAHGNPTGFDFVTVEQGWVVATGDYNAAPMDLNTGSYYKGVGGYPGHYGTSRMLMVELKTGFSGGPAPGYYGPTLYEDGVMLRYQQPPDTYQEVFRPQGTHHGEISHCSFYCQTSLVTGNQSMWFANGNADQDIHMHHTILFNGSSLMRVPEGGVYVGDHNVFLAGIPGDSSPVHFHHYSAGWCVTLAAWQAATGQDTNSVYLDRSDQFSGNPYAFWMGVREGINNGPEDGDWRVNPIARVRNGANTHLYGVFADGTPIIEAGPQNHWNWNTRASEAGAPTKRPIVPATMEDARAYINAPEAWRFYS